MPTDLGGLRANELRIVARYAKGVTPSTNVVHRSSDEQRSVEAQKQHLCGAIEDASGNVCLDEYCARHAS